VVGRESLNGPALSCRPPVSVPHRDGRPPVSRPGVPSEAPLAAGGGKPLQAPKRRPVSSNALFGREPTRTTTKRDRNCNTEAAAPRGIDRDR
jgi:hypothetical protein